MQEKTMPNGKNTSSAKPNLSGKKDIVEEKPSERRIEWDLSDAAFNGWIDVVRDKLKEGADVNEKDKYNRTPLMEAAAKGHVKVCEILIENGARLEDRDALSGWTALVYAVTQLTYSEDICAFLISKGANANATDKEGKTPLMLAAKKGNIRTCRLLIENGAYTGLRDYDNLNAETHALRNRHFGMAMLIRVAPAGFLQFFRKCVGG